MNQNSGWYETFFRGYDPTLGRFHQVDPLAHASTSHSPYNYAYNDPVFYNDPDGDYPREVKLDMERSGGGSVYNYGELGFNSNYFAGGGSGNPWGGGMMGPGSGNHWSDSYSSSYRDYFLMNTDDFEARHNQTRSEFREKMTLAEASENGEYYEVFFGYGFMPHITMGNGGDDGKFNGNIYLFIFDESSGKSSIDLFSKAKSIEEMAPNSWIPIYDDVRKMGYWADHGDWSRVGLYGMSAVSSVTGIRAVAKAAIKLGAKLLAKQAAKGGTQGGLNLFKWGAEQTGKSTGWKAGDYMLHLPNKGTPALNWKANYGALRSEMNLGKPIFDSYRLPNGNLIPTRGFLNAERSILQGRGWIYNPGNGAWMPPGF